MDPWASTNQGLANLTSTLGTLAQFKRQDRLDAEQAQDHAKARTLADLQLKTEQQKFDDKAALRTELANVQGKYLYPEPQGVGPMQPEKAQTLSDLGPVQQPATAENRLGVMADLASKGNTAAMDQYGNAYSLNQKLAEQRAKVAEYGDLESAARIDEMLGKMEKSGKLLESWMKTDPTGEMAKQGIVAMPDLFPNFDPAKMKIGKQGEPPAYFDAPDGGHTFFDGKEWKHIAAAKPATDVETWGEPEQMTVGGKTAMVQKSNRGQIRPVIQDTAPRVTVTTGGQKPAPASKPPSGYRYNADGTALEPIPGGPVAQGQDKAKSAYDSSIAVVDKLLNHPGRKAATGLSSALDPRNYIPGTNATDFQKELESFDAVLFLSNIEKMKGMGALSNAEGAKVSAAAGAIKPGMSEKAFESNLKIIRGELEKAKTRIDSGNMSAPPPGGKTATKGKSAGYSDLLNKHRK
jgi:hypothetical protein